jgi:glycine/D-amino acid oxidase-like deaminating enzyme
MTEPVQAIAKIDAAIVGGGIAGLWLLKLLTRSGFNVVLLERDALGCDQTMASQGMIHGGMKYALAGVLTGASEAIAGMPDRWRECLRGNDPVDLSGTALLSNAYYMFASSTLGKFATLAGSKALRGRIDRLDEAEWPDAFDGFGGTVYRLNDFVLDTKSLLEHLLAGLEDRVFKLDANPHSVARNDWGYRIQLEDLTLEATQLISCAGNGAAALLTALEVPSIRVQQRPLKQIIARPRHNIRLYGHCLTKISSTEPRLTITSHDGRDGLIWYVGGEFAGEGAAFEDDRHLALAQEEIQRNLDWLDWTGTEYEVLSVDRAEPYQTSGLRPDEAYVRREGSFIQCFPTKLTLAPDMGDKLLNVIEQPRHTDPVESSHLRAPIGQSPWS